MLLYNSKRVIRAEKVLQEEYGKDGEYLFIGTPRVGFGEYEIFGSWRANIDQMLYWSLKAAAHLCVYGYATTGHVLPTKGLLSRVERIEVMKRIASDCLREVIDDTLLEYETLREANKKGGDEDGEDLFIRRCQLACFDRERIVNKINNDVTGINAGTSDPFESTVSGTLQCLGNNLLLRDAFKYFKKTGGCLGLARVAAINTMKARKEYLEQTDSPCKNCDMATDCLHFEESQNMAMLSKEIQEYVSGLIDKQEGGLHSKGTKVVAEMER